MTQKIQIDSKSIGVDLINSYIDKGYRYRINEDLVPIYDVFIDNLKKRLKTHYIDATNEYSICSLFVDDKKKKFWIWYDGMSINESRMNKIEKIKQCIL